MVRPRLDEFGLRNQGCEAVLHDKGWGIQDVPVCMGGVAIGGCNNPESCKPLFVERSNEEYPDSYVYVFHEGSKNGKRVINRVTFVRRSLESAVSDEAQ
ncbi:MAG: hypothetical protein AAB459_02900 [Patescibacteria group bacterium]